MRQFNFLDFFRKLFTIRPFEKWLAMLTIGKSPKHLVSRFAPNPYQYAHPSVRLVTRHGIKIKVDLSDYIGHYIYFGFCDPSLNSLLALCEPTYSILDIGTNIGHTLLCLSRVAKEGKVIGFEPDPINIQNCRFNLKQNNFSNVALLELALGEKEGIAEIDARTPGNRGANRISIVDTGNASIKVTTLDLIFNSLEIKRIDLMKIDVEGFELKVLRGGKDILQRFKPILFIEVNDENLRHNGDTAHDLLSFLIDLGYSHLKDAETGVDVTVNSTLLKTHFDLVAR